MRKNPIARRTALAAAASLPLVFVRRAEAAGLIFKYANNLPLAHPMNVRAKAAAARIASGTDGRVTIRIFPNNVLGGDTDMLSQVRSGAIQFFTLSGLILATLVPVASINGIGFAFKDYDQVWAAMDGPLGAYVRSAIAKSGLLAMDRMWDNGYRQITSSTHPIAVPADLRGFKIRVPVSPLWTSMFRAFGAAPTAINFNEVYSALQSHIVDGQENPLADHRHGEALRGPEILLAHQPHVGRVLDARQSCRLGAHLAGRPDRRRFRLERCRGGRAGGRGEAQRDA